MGDLPSVSLRALAGRIGCAGTAGCHPLALVVGWSTKLGVAGGDRDRPSTSRCLWLIAGDQRVLQRFTSCIGWSRPTHPGRVVPISASAPRRPLPSHGGWPPALSVGLYSRFGCESNDPCQRKLIRLLAQRNDTGVSLPVAARARTKPPTIRPHSEPNGQDPGP